MEIEDKILPLVTTMFDLFSEKRLKIGEVLKILEIFVTSTLEQVHPKERRHRVLMEFISNLIQISLKKHIDEVTNQEK